MEKVKEFIANEYAKMTCGDNKANPKEWNCAEINGIYYCYIDNFAEPYVITETNGKLEIV